MTAEIKNENRIEYDDNGNARSFVGREAVNVYAMAVLASGLHLYAKTGIKPNRAYTPSAMMKAAAQYTGQKFKARDYEGAAAALFHRVQAEKERIARLSGTGTVMIEGREPRYLVTLADGTHRRNIPLRAFSTIITVKEMKRIEKLGVGDYLSLTRNFGTGELQVSRLS